MDKVKDCQAKRKENLSDGFRRSASDSGHCTTDATSHKRKLMSLLQMSMETLWRGLMLSWKAQCGESRMLCLGRGKGCEALPIATKCNLCLETVQTLEDRGTILLLLELP